MFQHADSRDDETKPPEINGPKPCPLNRGRVVNGRPEGWHWFDDVRYHPSPGGKTDSCSACACGLTYWYDVTLSVEED